MQQQTSHKILPVIVIYENEVANSSAFETLRKNFGLEQEIFIYDNSKTSQITSSQIEALNIIYLHDSTNPGVSKAYNVAAEYAKKNEYDLILLSDQDTKFPDNLREEFEVSYQKHNTQKIFFPRMYSKGKLISPAKFSFCRATYADDPQTEIIDLKKLRPINSGLFIKLEHFFRNNGYREDVFLDYSDFDFVERGLSFCGQGVLINCKCEHDLSDIYNVTIEVRDKRIILRRESMLNYAKGSIWRLFLVRFWLRLKEFKTS